MTPKEKAKELVEKFEPLVVYWDCYNDAPMPSDDILADAKQCALVTADEVLSYMGADRGTEFWQEVKIEIEKL